MKGIPFLWLHLRVIKLEPQFISVEDKPRAHHNSHCQLLAVAGKVKTLRQTESYFELLAKDIQDRQKFKEYIAPNTRVLSRERET